MRNKSGKAALVIAVLALLSSLTGFSPAAGFIITSSKQIKPGVVLSSDIHKNGVRSSDLAGGAVKTSDIGTGQVTTSDIGEGQVTPEDVTAPPPVEAVVSGGTVEVGTGFAATPLAATFTKTDPTSVLEVEWNGTANAGFSGCIFQLRVNGQPPNAQGGGEVFVASSSTWSGSSSALFGGLGAGPIRVEIWTRAINESNVAYPCTAGPNNTIKQTLAMREIVV